MPHRAGSESVSRRAAAAMEWKMIPNALTPENKSVILTRNKNALVFIADHHRLRRKAICPMANL